MKIYGIKTCDTCRKAQKALPEAEFVDVRTDGLPGAVLTRALETFGDRMLNTRSTTWRGLSDADRKKEPVWLIATYPTLMKRPLFETDAGMHLGFDAKTREALGV